MYIDSEVNGIVDLSTIQTIGRMFLINEKEYVIIFFTKNNGTGKWKFDNAAERDAVYKKIKELLESKNVDVKPALEIVN